MLAAAHRLRRPADFTAVLRRGVRAGRSSVVLHLLLPDGDAGAHPHPHPDAVPVLTPARVGFIVPKAVGGSVVRHRVVRQLRALMAARIDEFPPGSRCVVRALAPAADLGSAGLAIELDNVVRRALQRASSETGGHRSADPSLSGAR